MPETQSAKPLGGYIELQLPDGVEYYPNLIKLNTARNCLEYIIRIKGYTLIYIPYYTCDVILDTVKNLGIAYQFYHVDVQLDPVFDFSIGPNECFLYTNYFGLKENTVKALKEKIGNLIVDNAQAFFSFALPGVDTFYSCRKFFGVPDGAYLQLNSQDRLTLASDVSVSRFSHLIKRIDLGAEGGYSDFIANNVDLEDNEIKNMSALSQRMMKSIDYAACQEARNDNFNHLHRSLSSYNELTIDPNSVNGPMAYPLLVPHHGLKTRLIAEKIFVPTYWPNVFDWVSSDSDEFYLAEHLLALPIDHRYDRDDMNRIVDILKELL